MIVKHAIYTDLKNKLTRLYNVNSILFMSYSIILYHNYLNKRKKYLEKVFNWSSCLGFTSLNVLPTCLFFKTSL